MRENNTTSFSIVEYEEKYEAILVELMHEFYHSEAVFQPVADNNFYQTSAVVLKDRSVANIFLVFDSENPVGYTQFSFIYSNEFGGKVIWLDEIYIRDIYQNQGLGSTLIHSIQEQYKDEAKAIRLEIEHGNLSAKKLYTRLGFEEYIYQPMFLSLELNKE